MTAKIHPERDLCIRYFLDICNHFALEVFEGYSKGGLRVGQSFMNSLPWADYSILSGSIRDPFYNDAKIPEAIEWLEEVHTRPSKQQSLFKEELK